MSHLCNSLVIVRNKLCLCYVFYVYVYPRLPRKKRAPARIEECLGESPAPEFDDDVVSHYRKIYYESLDCIINAVEDRFDQEDFKTYIKLTNFLLKAAKGSDFDSEYNDVMALYDSDFEGIRFQVQLETLSEYCKEIVDTGLFVP